MSELVLLQHLITIVMLNSCYIICLLAITFNVTKVPCLIIILNLFITSKFIPPSNSPPPSIHHHCHGGGGHGYLLPSKAYPNGQERQVGMGWRPLPPPLFSLVLWGWDEEKVACPCPPMAALLRSPHGRDLRAYKLQPLEAASFKLMNQEGLMSLQGWQWRASFTCILKWVCNSLTPSLPFLLSFFQVQFVFFNSIHYVSTLQATNILPSPQNHQIRSLHHEFILLKIITTRGG